MRNRGLLGPWEKYRKAGLGAAILIALFVYIVTPIPLGFVLLGLLFALARIWKGLMITDPLLGTYTVQTVPYKVATFFTAYRENFATTIAPVVSVGAGPPAPDPDHGLEPGFFPIGRLSSVWALLGALILGCSEFALSWAHYPFYGSWVIPPFIMAPLSALGFFMLIQTVLATMRIQGDVNSLRSSDVNPRPAAILSKVRADLPVIEIVKSSAKVAAAPTVLFLLLYAVARWPFWITLVVTPGILLFTAAVSASRAISAAYVAGWEERAARRDFWFGTFAYLKDKTPTLASEIDLPSAEDYAATVDPDDEDAEPYSPELKVATFLYPPNAVFSDYVGHEDRILGALNGSAANGVELCAIAPIGNYSAEAGEQSGTVGSQGFRVWWTEREIPHLLDPDVGTWTRDFLTRAIVVPGLASIRGIGWCTLLSSTMVTRPDSDKTVFEVKVIPPPGVNLESFLDRLEEIRSVLDVPWVRAGRVGGRGTASSAISLYIGHYPDLEKTKFINPAAIVRRTIDQMDWSYYFNSRKLSGTTGVPKLVERRPTTKIVDKLVFELPDGLAYESVASQIGTLALTSGNEFMEIELGAELDPRRMSREAMIRAESAQSSKFTIVAAKNDPLKRVFDFGDYTDKLLTGREAGTEKIEWSPGVLADDTLASYRFDDELPHLLIAGSSGSGKSVVANSMIIQMAYNNGPNELRFWMIEPKNEMQVFKDLDVTERFVDSWTPDKNFMTNAADLMEDAVEEMNRRYEVMKNHPKFPKKLEKARELARRESISAGTPLEDHPLYMPFIVLIVEECATLFADASDKDEKAEQGRLMSATAEIARKARAAGIYLVCLTQYPTNVSIPSVIRNQMRRVGLMCQNRVASDVVIGESGLEKIKVKGVGKVSVRGTYKNFRGFWVKDGDPDDGEANDVLDVIAKMPSRPGASVSLGRGGAAVPEVVIPAPADGIFTLWEQSGVGRAVGKAVDVGKATKDKNDAAVPAGRALSMT